MVRYLTIVLLLVADFCLNFCEIIIALLCLFRTVKELKNSFLKDWAKFGLDLCYVVRQVLELMTISKKYF